MASEHKLQLKAVLDTTDVKRKLEDLRSQANLDSGNSGSSGNGLNASFTKLNATLAKLNTSIDALKSQLGKQTQRNKVPNTKHEDQYGILNKGFARLAIGGLILNGVGSNLNQYFEATGNRAGQRTVNTLQNVGSYAVMGGMAGGPMGAAIGAAIGGLQSAIEAWTQDIKDSQEAIKYWNAQLDKSRTIDKSIDNYFANKGVNEIISAAAKATSTNSPEYRALQLQKAKTSAALAERETDLMLPGITAVKGLDPVRDKAIIEEIVGTSYKDLTKKRFAYNEQLNAIKDNMPSKFISTGTSHSITGAPDLQANPAYEEALTKIETLTGIIEVLEQIEKQGPEVLQETQNLYSKRESIVRAMQAIEEKEKQLLEERTKKQTALNDKIGDLELAYSREREAIANERFTEDLNFNSKDPYHKQSWINWQDDIEAVKDKANMYAQLAKIGRADYKKMIDYAKQEQDPDTKQKLLEDAARVRADYTYNENQAGAMESTLKSFQSSIINAMQSIPGIYGETQNLNQLDAQGYYMSDNFNQSFETVESLIELKIGKSNELLQQIKTVLGQIRDAEQTNNGATFQ